MAERMTADRKRRSGECGSACRLMVLAALLLAASACFKVGNTTSVAVGVSLPGPWDGVTIDGPVVVGRP